MTNKIIANVTTITALVLFISSLTQKSFCTRECGDAFMTLLIGWMGVLLDVGHLANALTDFASGEGFSLRYPIGAAFTWLANPAMFLSLMFIKEKNSKAALFFAALSALLALSFLLFTFIADNEGGVYNKITGYKAGYWLWVSSTLTVLIGAAVLKIRGKDQEKRPITSDLAKAGQNTYLSTLNR